MSISQQIARKPRIIVPSGIRKPRLNIVQTISGSGTSAIWFNFKQSGNHVYAANHTGGVDVIDVSTPASASIIDTLASGNARDIDIAGTTLVTAARATNGDFKTWDISNPASIPAVLDTHTGTAQKYSALVVDGADVYVAGQVSGAHKFSVAVPGTIPAPTSNTSGAWETQGITLSGNYVFFANYNNGLRILDKATLGGVTDNIVPAPSLNGQLLRIWECVISDDGNWLFATTNVTTASGSAIERGLAILNISNPTTSFSASDWIIAPVGSHDVDTWNDAGDMPLLGLVYHNGYIFAGNGQKGVAMWHVVDPTRPTYQGLLTGIDSGDNITAIGTFNILGKTYLIFGDGARTSSTDGTDKLYIGEIII